MSYFLYNYEFYQDSVKLFTFKRSDYIINSILRIEDIKGNSIIKCKIFPWIGFKSLRILEQNLENEITFIKKRVFYLRVSLNNNVYEITILPKPQLSLKFKGDFVVNNKKVGVVVGKIEGLSTKHYFEFDEIGSELIYYCLIYFAVRYYDIDDVA